MNKKENDELFAAHLPGILSYHRQMLGDGVRNRLLFEVIKNCVNSETNFLDIGAGTGVWAILAAKLGAKRSVAVEIEESLIPIIFRHAQENGVAHKVEIIHANADDVKIRGKFDVIVSEVFGGGALGAETINSFVQLRSRFLAPNGVLIPQKLAMFAVPVKIEHSAQKIPADLPIKSDFINSLKSNYFWNATLADRQKIKFLAEPKELVEIDFRIVENAPVLSNLSLSWQMKNLPEANAFAVFNYSIFSDEVKMDNFESQSWGTTVYEFQPFLEKSGELKFDLTIAENKSIWTVSLPSNAEVKPQTFSPVFAAARIKMAHQMTPHRRFKPLKVEKSKQKSR